MFQRFFKIFYTIYNENHNILLKMMKIDIFYAINSNIYIGIYKTYCAGRTALASPRLRHWFRTRRPLAFLADEPSPRNELQKDHLVLHATAPCFNL
jgi:hypothetical protein